MHNLNLKLILLLFLFSISAYAMQPIIVQGYMKNDKSENLKDYKFTLIDQSGKKINSKTDHDGNFSVVLAAGNVYTLVTKGLVSDYTTIDLTNASDYAELTKNFILKKLDVDYHLYSFDLFKENSSTIAFDRDKINEIKDFIKNHNVKKIKFTINSGDTYLAPKGRKKKIQKLLENRKKSLAMALFELDFNEKYYEIITEYVEHKNKKNKVENESNVLISQI